MGEEERDRETVEQKLHFNDSRITRMSQISTFNGFSVLPDRDERPHTLNLYRYHIVMSVRPSVHLIHLAQSFVCSETMAFSVNRVMYLQCVL